MKLVVDAWTVTFGTTRRGLGGAIVHPGPRPLLVAPNVTAHLSTASVGLPITVLRVSILTHDIDIANLSVRPFVAFQYQMKTA